MKRWVVHFSVVALWLLAIASLVAIPFVSGIAYAVGLAKGHYVQVFGRNVVGEPHGAYSVVNGEIAFCYFEGRGGTPPPRGWVYQLPGIIAYRELATLPGETGGVVISAIRVRWWLLLFANALAILLAFRLAQALLRLRHVPGLCPACGYDLRATPDRCPECGHRPQPVRGAPHGASTA